MQGCRDAGRWGWRVRGRSWSARPEMPIGFACSAGIKVRNQLQRTTVRQDGEGCLSNTCTHCTCTHACVLSQMVVVGLLRPLVLCDVNFGSCARQTDACGFERGGTLPPNLLLPGCQASPRVDAQRQPFAQVAVKGSGGDAVATRPATVLATQTPKPLRSELPGPSRRRRVGSVQAWP